MAAGKTTLGRLLAEHLDRPFIDSDEQIERRFGMTARDLAAAHGVPALHAAEARALVEALDAHRPSVIAAAASVADSPMALRTLAGSNAVVVLVDSPIPVLADRLRAASGHRRPMQLDELAARTAERRKALLELEPEVVVDTSLTRPNESAAEIVETIGWASGL